MMQKQYDDDQPKSARYAKNLALQRAENQVHRSMEGEEHPALDKYRKKNVESAHATYDHAQDASQDHDEWNPAPGPVAESMHMPGPIHGVNLQRYMMQHGMNAAQYMGREGSNWQAVKTPLEGRDSMTSDIKTGDHDQDDYVNNDEQSLNDRGRRQVGSY
jgi:hypothetical protein